MNNHMKILQKCLMSALLLLYSQLLLAESELISVWKDRRAQSYQSYTSQQLRFAQEVFEQLLFNAPTQEIHKKLHRLKLSVQIINNLILISEAHPPYTGQGLYVIRMQSANTLLLQAPHAYHDLKTGRIALKMMSENKIRALAVNTINRRYTLENGDNKNADMAHLSDSLFVAFSRAFAKVVNNGKLVQLHGFNTKKYPQTPPLEVILSNGTRANNQQLYQHKNCIEGALSVNVKLFPADVNILGGTTNTIGKSVRSLGFSGFKHIEMSLPVRQKLNKSAHKRRNLTRCLIE